MMVMMNLIPTLLCEAEVLSKSNLSEVSLHSKSSFIDTSLSSNPLHNNFGNILLKTILSIPYPPSLGLVDQVDGHAVVGPAGLLDAVAPPAGLEVEGDGVGGGEGLDGADPGAPPV